MKNKVIDTKLIMEIRRFAALVQSQSGIRLNVDNVVKTRDGETLRVWEKTFQSSNEMKNL